METIIKIFTEYEVAAIIIIFIMFCLAIKGIIDFIVWIREKLNAWRKRTNEGEDKIENLETRVSSVESSIESLKKTDEVMNDALNTINTKLDDIREEAREQFVVTDRSALHRIANEVRSQGYITSQQYEVFNEMSRHYIKNNGNGLFRNKIIPEIEAMEVRD